MTTTNESALREEITRVGQSLYARGYTVGTAGNISARLPDGWLITPTDACLGTLDPARIAKVLATGEWVSGDKPSKTLALHRGIYDRNAEAHAVVHTHSTHLVALTLAGVWHEADVLPPITPYYVMKVGHVPLIAYRRPGHSMWPRGLPRWPMMCAPCCSTGWGPWCGTARCRLRLTRWKNWKKPHGFG